MTDRPRLSECTSVAVLTDIHGNAPAYERALELARTREVDRIVILGDLLSYGVHPERVLKVTDDAVHEENAIVVRGNHDQLYVDMARGDNQYYSRLPDWIRESADWTAAHADVSRLHERYPWTDQHVIGNILFSHANPFASGDWSYLNHDGDFVKAARALESRGYSMGVFGHTHRAKTVSVSGDEVRVDASPTTMIKAATVVVDPGSIGQPRDSRKKSSFAILTDAAEAMSVEIVDIDYDLDAYEQAVRSSNMSEATIEKLLGYLR